MRLRSNYKLKSGFTLIELVLGIALIAIIVVTFYSAFTFSMDNIFTMGRKSIATRIAEECVEPYYDNDPNNATTLSVAAAKIVEIDNAYPLYTIATPVVTGPSGDGLYTVEIVVFYRQGTRNVKLVAITP